MQVCNSLFFYFVNFDIPMGEQCDVIFPLSDNAVLQCLAMFDTSSGVDAWCPK